jgi:hypothetical protein
MKDVDLEVAEECKRRGVSRVCHFTQSRKLAHILSEPLGIRSVAVLSETGADTLNQNDPSRFDGRPDCINCSIEYPNTHLMRVLKERETLFKDWVVLLIHPRVLWRKGTVFTPLNAAARASKHAEGLSGIRAIYAPSVPGKYGKERQRTETMLPCCPTDDQAEALIPHSISRELILGIAVATEGQADMEAGRLSLCKDVPPMRWVVAPALFTGEWSPRVRTGIRPLEREYEPKIIRRVRPNHA